MPSNKLLLVVDPQYDFIEGGSLPVNGAQAAMDTLAQYVTATSGEYALRIATADWHSFHHCSFTQQGGQWPMHCVQHSRGAAIYQPLLMALNDATGDFAVLTKGTLPGRDEYSIMQNAASSRQLLNMVRERGITHIDVCGLAGDVCVLNTAHDLMVHFGPSRLTLLTQFSPSLDGGAKLATFIEGSHIATK